MSGQVEKTLMLLSYHPDANKVLDDFSVKATLVLITGDLPAGKTKMKFALLRWSTDTGKSSIEAGSIREADSSGYPYEQVHPRNS
jgi:hypothetical protein